ncbi:MAG: asparagine synthase (glutamine-hydrolyzing) [Burkholderiales bacterium]|nr:asparagine synthase (glutamine-hydrolyzing) [Burkholderiales bacterium]
MCGIAGIVVRASGFALDRSLREMAAAIAHRGPDGEGLHLTATRDATWRVGLAHRRLSIIDLEAGAQPLGNEDGSVQIVFNGEIYNFAALREELLALGHVFRTRSDTEVIVHAYEQWGPDCVERLHGMFAFAIWDAPRERLLLARDRFGKKPLFIAQRDGLLLFGSEIKAIVASGAHPPEVNLAGLRDYFDYRYMPAPATLLRGVRKLAPGSIALWARGVLTERRWYSPPDRLARIAPAGADASGDVVAGFLARLDEAVRIRLVSDVPFGAFLSGGIDSSAVVALMSRHASEPVSTFSVGFADAAYSELRHARSIADHFRTRHTELIVSQDDLMDQLPALVRFRDAPVAEPSDVPIHLLALQAAQSVKMVLTGEGADELLGGYPKHAAERVGALYRRLPVALRRSLIEPAVRALPFGLRRLRTALAAFGLDDPRQRMIRWFGAASPSDLDELLALAPAPGRDLPPSDFPFDIGEGNSALRAILHFDQTSWLPDNLLERGDRMTMAASIEARMPFMDHELAAFVSTLDDRWRIRGGTGKQVLRLAMAQLLPREILERPKVGFRVPVSDWFRGSMKGYLHEHLLGAESRTRDYYRLPALRRVLAEHAAGTRNHEKLLWTMLSLEIWQRECL